ncbi:hypothetical protein V5O48_012379, partial [Marasmius crinis-equi]
MSSFDPADRMAEINTKIREAIRAALPAPPEQFFTVMIPGKVVNLEDYAHGFTDTGKKTTPLLPTATELAQARLCDDMPTYAPFQLGPTGRSVARSYGAALSKLVPAGTTVGIDTGDSLLSESQIRYKNAMKWLTELDPRTSKTRVELYTQRQHLYTEAVENKTRAFAKALDDAKKMAPDPNDVHSIRQTYDQWVQENAKTYRNYVQAAYMDWVITGKKEEVEYYFSIVDQDSAMSRVEQSKEAMRSLVVQDPDGVVEYQKVTLEPDCWARYALNKMGKKDSIRTAEWYTFEITRLQKMNAILDAMRDGPPSSQAALVAAKDADASAKVDPKLKQIIKDFVDASENHKKVAANEKSTPEEKAAAFKKYEEKKGEMERGLKNTSKEETANLGNVSAAAQKAIWDALKSPSSIASQTIGENETLIRTYVEARAKLTESTSKSQLISEVTDAAGVSRPLRDPQAQSSNDSAAKGADFFTQISVDVSSAESSESSSSSAMSVEARAKASYGRWWFKTSVEVATSHSSAHSDVERSMAKNACKISFECMRVDINRAWMRPELFYDADLTVPTGEFISPGWSEMKDLMERSSGLAQEPWEKEMQRYSTFPMYPT